MVSGLRRTARNITNAEGEAAAEDARRRFEAELGKKDADLREQSANVEWLQARACPTRRLLQLVSSFALSAYEVTSARVIVALKLVQQQLFTPRQQQRSLRRELACKCLMRAAGAKPLHT